jgi:hypothetical protein
MERRDDLHILAQQRCFVLGCANWNRISNHQPATINYRPAAPLPSSRV